MDGKYGTKTEAAVKAYQKRQGLTVDGKVGSQTWNRMF
ncbi:peptidoglycan-binding protein [Bacillales bacterium AN1005]